LSLLQLDVQNGLVFTNDIKNQSDPNSGFGAYYSTNRFYAGFSISNLLENNFSEITQITDEDGKLQKYGSFTDDKVTVPIKSIMVDKLRGNYIATLTAKMKIGKTLMRQTKLHLEVAVACELYYPKCVGFPFNFGWSSFVFCSYYSKLFKFRTF